MRNTTQTSSSLPDEDFLRATFVVPRALADEFRLVAQRNDRSFSGELRQLMRDAIARDRGMLNRDRAA